MAFKDSGLLIVGHGSTVNASSSAPTWEQAQVIEQRQLFAEVRCAFWKEEPSLRDARFFYGGSGIRDVFLVPNFISEGYFTRQVIPRELELTGAITYRENGQRWHYCEPVGNHPAMTELLLARARAVAAQADPTETALFIVGHGTALNDNSALAAKREAERIRTRGIYADVFNAYMEEPPLIADWDKLTSAHHVVVVPFFIADGLHSFEDIPALLGLPRATAFAANPHRLRGRSLYYAGAIGTDPAFAELIVEQARNAGKI